MHTYTFIKMDDPHYSIFFSVSISLFFSRSPFSPLFLSLLLWPGEFDWQTHTHIEEKKTRADCYDYIRPFEPCLCLLCDYDRLILCFISSIQGGSFILYMSRGTKRIRKNDRDKEEEKTEWDRPLRMVA